MTDEKPKNAWTRCPTCSTVMPNIQIAKDGHKLNCPHDMQLKLKTALEKIEVLEEAMKHLGGNLDELSSEPSVDFSGVEEWDPEGPAEDEPAPGGEPFVQDVERDEWDDDENSLASSPAGTIPFQR